MIMTNSIDNINKSNNNNNNDNNNNNNNNKKKKNSRILISDGNTFNIHTSSNFIEMSEKTN